MNRERPLLKKTGGFLQGAGRAVAEVVACTFVGGGIGLLVGFGTEMLLPLAPRDGHYGGALLGAVVGLILGVVGANGNSGE